VNTHLLSKLAAAALLLLVAVPAKADHTNLVRTLHIQLQGLKQGATITSSTGNSTTTADTVSVGNRQVIKALGDATGNTFSSTSKVVVVTPLHYPGGTKVQVRDGTSVVDVTGFFSRYPLSDSVFSSQSSSRTGRSNSNEYNIQEFDLVDNSDYAPLALHYYVSGIAVISTSSSPSNGTTTELNASVSGTGDLNGDLLILQGTISLKGQTYETAPDGPPPGV
jgi:hypothetical protein